MDLQFEESGHAMPLMSNARYPHSGSPADEKDDFPLLSAPAYDEEHAGGWGARSGEAKQTLQQWSDRVPTVQRKTLRLVALLVVAVLMLGWGAHSARQARLSRPIELVEPIVAKVLPPCTKVLLLDWGSLVNGFGSSSLLVLHAGLFAEHYGYTLLVDFGWSTYGSYYDYFKLAPLQCVPDGDMWKMDSCRAHKNGCVSIGPFLTWERIPPTSNVLFVSQQDVWPLNDFIRGLAYDRKELWKMPGMDSSMPYAEDVVPSLMMPSFLKMSSLTTDLFTLTDKLENVTQGLRKDLGLLLSPDERRAAGMPAVIGVHFRGGDKLWNECKPSSVVSCANVTLLAETAWLGVVRYGGHSKEKPVLRIMTTEPGMVEKFSEDKIGSRFQVLLMPLSDIASFFQGTFNRRPFEEKVTSTGNMMATMDVLARYADTFVVTTNSNVGRIAVLRGHGTDVVHPSDSYWYPTHDFTWG